MWWNLQNSIRHVSYHSLTDRSTFGCKLIITAKQGDMIWRWGICRYVLHVRILWWKSQSCINQMFSTVGPYRKLREKGAFMHSWLLPSTYSCLPSLPHFSNYLHSHFQSQSLHRMCFGKQLNGNHGINYACTTIISTSNYSCSQSISTSHCEYHISFSFWGNSSRKSPVTMFANVVMTLL
jgi:hypothetical protein